MMKSAKYVLFDIDDTLFPSTEFSGLARKNAINAMLSMGLKSDFATLSAMLDAIIKKKGSNYSRHFDDLLSAIKAEEPSRYIAAAVGAYHDTKATIAPFPTVPLTLLRLREEGYRLHVATSGSAIKQWDKLIRLRIALYFEGVFVTEELGEDKGAEFYRKILSRLGAGAGECVMVGDREEADIVPAREVGLRTVRMLAGKYSDVPTSADYAMKDMRELLRILQDL